ncbi:MAG: hypothetical protein MH252_09775 [Thermosynechococcaceae cyanobacterium MS004]|nr:hypothetical protein [Thermosynechococcaceae cyanobacterium MS004]
MVSNQIRRTSVRRRKVVVPSNHVSTLAEDLLKREEALYLIDFRLRESALLESLKQRNLESLYSRLKHRGYTQSLERELERQQQELKTLNFIASEWQSLAEKIAEGPCELSDEGQILLKSLGVDIPSFKVHNRYLNQ